MENQICSSKLATPSPLLSMHKSSQTISKSKPKVRIIHIFAPEIIKTDAENFRELVQRLTGKPTDDDDRNKKTKPRILRTKDQKIFSSSKKKLFHAEFRERIKGEEEIWSGANSGGGFLGGFADQFEYGFMQEINDQFPFLEGTTQMDAYGESGTIC
ncbi:hypothetical protein PHJA_001306200 [Phtheirospermum japonicum]|uniref:VQ domain-containing protein n=1 Tax=Phtheirospermum japonicum TaxID=374723 RepID=A0A830C0E8_9LAMI|nr:hypothetical protein PHJA_001306200 [Phtheirospermum japonicum]